MIIGIIGLGTIGKKLCEYLSEKKHFVIAYNHRNIDNKSFEIKENIYKKVKFNKIKYSDFEQVIKRISFTDDLKSLINCDLIIDSSKEKYDIKENIYYSLKEIGYENSVLVTTSSLNLDTLSQYYLKGKIIGYHFFNPPTKMKLIELVFLEDTEQEIKKKIYKFGNSLDDKKIIEVPNIQGYIANRIIFAYINTAINLKFNYNIQAEIIDDSLKFGMNVPMGPLELSDYIGNDITYDILNEFFISTGDEIYRLNKNFVKMIKNKLFGRKNKKGFYNY